MFSLDVKQSDGAYYKNMVCNRCIMLVQNELEKLGLNLKSIKLGEITLSSEPTTQELFKLKKALLTLGFEIIDDRRNRTIERRKKKEYNY